MQALSTEPALLMDEGTRAMEQARVLLLEASARNVEIACSALSTAMSRMRSLQPHLAAVNRPGSDLRYSLHDMRHRVAHVSELLEQAASYHVQLLHRMLDAGRDAAPAAAPQGGMNRGVHLQA
jgi:hypothetical protein